MFNKSGKTTSKTHRPSLHPHPIPTFYQCGSVIPIFQFLLLTSALCCLKNSFFSSGTQTPNTCQPKQALTLTFIHLHQLSFSNISFYFHSVQDYIYLYPKVVCYRDVTIWKIWYLDYSDQIITVNAASSLKTQRKFARPLGGLDLWDRGWTIVMCFEVCRVYPVKNLTQKWNRLSTTYLLLLQEPGLHACTQTQRHTPTPLSNSL